MGKTSAVSRACQVCGQLGHVSNFIQTPHSNLRKQDSSKHQSQAPKRFDSTLKIFADRASSNRTEQASGEGTYMRFQYAPLKSKPTMFQPINPCPVCGAETTLAEIEPHPVCTPILKFTATSVTDVDPPNPWLCFAHHHFNR